MAATLVVLGNINQDFVVEVERAARPGETVLGKNLRFAAGGKGANQSVTAARLGANVTLIGRVGDDAFGPTLLENLRREGVETRYVGTGDEQAGGVALISLFPDGQNCIISVPGANYDCQPRHVEDAHPFIRHADICMVTLGMFYETVRLFIDIAADGAGRLLLDPTPIREALPPNWTKADIMTPNETEAEWVSGIPVTDENSALAAARKMFEAGVKLPIVKLGAGGCVVLDADGARLIPGFVVQPVDTTGAGDAFAAGLAVALAEGLSVNQAAAFANACGAIACTRFGAQPSLPRRQEVETFLAEHGGLDGVTVKALS
jgi:ribokinase